VAIDFAQHFIRKAHLADLSLRVCHVVVENLVLVSIDFRFLKLQSEDQIRKRLDVSLQLHDSSENPSSVNIKSENYSFDSIRQRVIRAIVVAK
jgi:hypothetical protein